MNTDNHGRHIEQIWKDLGRFMEKLWNDCEKLMEF